MSREVLTMALEAIENIHNLLPTIGSKEAFVMVSKATTKIKEALAQQEHPEQMARLGWQYVECPACGSEGARAFPKPEQEPVIDYKAAYYSLLEKYDREAQPEQWKPEDTAHRPGGVPQDIPQIPQEHSSNEQFTPDWNTEAVLVEEMQRMAKQIAEMQDWEAVAADQAMTIAVMRSDERNFCPRCGKRLHGVLGNPSTHTCTPP